MHYLCFSQGDEPPHLVFSNRTWYCFPSSQQSSTSWTENSLERPPHLEYKGLFIDFCSLASSPSHRVVEGTYLDKNIGKLFQKLLPPSLLLKLVGTSLFDENCPSKARDLRGLVATLAYSLFKNVI